MLDEAGPSAWEDETFGVHFAFFSQTDPQARLRILEGRRIRLEEKRDRVRGALARTRERLDAYTLELQRHGLESVEREVRWLTELIETERSDGPPPTAAGAGPGGDRPPGAIPAPSSRTARSGQAHPVRSRLHEPLRLKERPQWVPYASPSSAWATAPPPSSRESSTTATPTRGARARPHARPARRLPRPRHRVRRRVRRRRQEGRPRPVRGDRRQREQHHQDRRRAAAGCDRPARSHPRRARQVLPC